MVSIWGDEDMACPNLFGINPYQRVDIYMFLEPGPDGATEVDFLLQTPGPYPGDYFICALPEYCGGHEITLGTLLDSPCRIVFNCKQNLFWVVRMPIMCSITANQSGYLAIVDNPEFGAVRIADCKDEIRPCSVYNYFGWNAECFIGTRESSWGAIKGLYRNGGD